MKKLNNSQPLAVSVRLHPLNTTMKVVPLGEAPLVQFYMQTTNQWFPDHTHETSFNEHGVQVDGVLRLRADYSIQDPDNMISEDAIVPVVYWFVNGTQVNVTDSTQDYYIVEDLLYVRKNLTHQEGATITCEVHFTDPRDGQALVLSDSVPLSAILKADEQWAVTILNDRTMKHHPLTSSPIYDFEAEARLGNTVKTNNVAWFWDYSLDNGRTWHDIDDDDESDSRDYWYVSGKNTKKIRIDMDFVKNLMLRCRIGVTDGTSTAAPDLPNEATASIAWFMPKLRPQVFSYGGDRVDNDTAYMRFGFFVHVPLHSDMSEAQKREWLLTSWIVRKQGVADSEVILDEHGYEVDIPQRYLISTAREKFIPDPQIGFRETYDVVATAEGEPIELSVGTFAIRC